MAVPDTLKWDLFWGYAKERPYNSIYTLELARLVGFG